MDLNLKLVDLNLKLLTRNSCFTFPRLKPVQKFDFNFNFFFHFCIGSKANFLIMGFNALIPANIGASLGQLKRFNESATNTKCLLKVKAIPFCFYYKSYFCCCFYLRSKVYKLSKMFWSCTAVGLWLPQLPKGNRKSNHYRCSVKKLFFKIWQISQENTCIGVPF